MHGVFGLPIENSVCLLDVQLGLFFVSNYQTPYLSPYPTLQSLRSTPQYLSDSPSLVVPRILCFQLFLHIYIHFNASVSLVVLEWTWI